MSTSAAHRAIRKHQNPAFFGASSSFNASSRGFDLVAEFISPRKVYTFRLVVGIIIPKSVKCIHSATKFKVYGRFRVLGLVFFLRV